MWSLSAGRAPIADALYGPGGYEHTILRMDSQELSIRISEETARSELEAMERRPDRELVHHYRHRDPQKATHGSIFLRLSDTRSVADEST